MKISDRKILTEFLGEEFNTIASVREEIGELGVLLYYGAKPELDNRTFDTWEDFGALWEKIEKTLQTDAFEVWNIKWKKRNFITTKTPIVYILANRCILVLEAIKEGVLK